MTSSAAQRRMEDTRSVHKIYDVIRIASRSEGTLEAEAVHIAAGMGDQITVARGICLPVHRAHVNVLKEAKHKRYVSEKDPVSGQEFMVHRGYTQRYPFDNVFRDIPEEVYFKLREHYTVIGAKEITEDQIQEMLDEYEDSLTKPTDIDELEKLEDKDKVKPTSVPTGGYVGSVEKTPPNKPAGKKATKK